MKLVSIITPCYNEEENVKALYEEIKKVFDKLPQFSYEHIFIDNCSKDKTVDILKGIASHDKNVKIIVNARNFGHIRSPYYCLLQTNGDCVIPIVADFQDPPELISEFLEIWERGFKIITAIKRKSKENPMMFLLRRIYYNTLARFSESEQVKNFTGFGLYDKSFIDVLRKIDDPYPYFRGLISELGFQIASVEYVQPKRLKGKSKNDFYTLYDIGMLGFINHSKLPLRLASFIGFFVAFFSLLVALAYVIYKILFWNEFQLGVAPLIFGIFFMGGIQLLFLGVIGEYIGAIFTQVRKRPLVIEKERINFDA